MTLTEKKKISFLCHRERKQKNVLNTQNGGFDFCHYVLHSLLFLQIIITIKMIIIHEDNENNFRLFYFKNERQILSWYPVSQTMYKNGAHRIQNKKMKCND